MKRCSTCKQLKEEDCFSKDAANGDGMKRSCRDCDSARHKRTRHLKRHDKGKERAGQIKRLYGITMQQHDEILKRQAGRCAICGVVPLFKPLRVDHDHGTGEVRGLLCHNCNTGIGMMRDDTDLLRLAIQYLEQNAAL